MAGFMVHAELHSSPRVTFLTMDEEGLGALGIWLHALSWMYSGPRARRLFPHSELAAIPEGQSYANRLVDAGFWTPTEGGYLPEPFDLDGRPLWKRAAPPSRPAIPAAIRDAVYLRDGYRCVTCGAVNHLSLDHIYPWSLGGPDTVDNLRVLCRSCNSRKGAKI